MSNRKRIEERIRRKEEEIQELEATIREAKAYLQALQDVIKLLPRDEAVSAESVLRPGSAVAEAREIIMKKGRPVHISQIITAMGREDDRKNRAAIAGSISAYVRRREIFTRPSPNTFGLVEFQTPEIPDNGDSRGAAQVPPPEFGGDDEDEIPF